MAKTKNEVPEGNKLESVENALSRTEQYIEENQKSLTIIVIAIAVIIAVYLGYKKFYLAPAEKNAQEEMFMAEKYFELDSFQLALDGDGSYLGFLDIINEYSVTKSANLSHYYAGVSYLRLGQYEDAIKHLKKFDSNDILVSTIALGAIGDAYVELGELDEAVSFFVKAAERKKNEFTSPIYLKKAGLVYENIGDLNKALDVYEKIEKLYPKSEEASDIQKYISKVKVKLNQV